VCVKGNDGRGKRPITNARIKRRGTLHDREEKHRERARSEVDEEPGSDNDEERKAFLDPLLLILRSRRHKCSIVDGTENPSKEGRAENSNDQRLSSDEKNLDGFTGLRGRGCLKGRRRHTKEANRGSPPSIDRQGRYQEL